MTVTDHRNVAAATRVAPPAARLYLVDLGLFLMAAAAGAVIADTYRFLIYEPKDVTPAIFVGVTAGLFIYLAVLGSPLALLSIAILRRLLGRGAARRPLILLAEVLAGLVFTFIVLNGDLAILPPLYMAIHGTPWILFGLIGRA